MPFYNPYLMSESRERMELQRKFFGKLFGCAAVYGVNTGADTVEHTVERVLRSVTGG